MKSMTTGSALKAVVLAILPTILFASAGLRTSWAADQSGYRLIGTIQSSTLIGAVIKDGTNSQSFYQLYDKLPDGSQIVKIHEDSISLKSPDGVLYDMYIAHEKIVGSAVPEAAAIEPSSPPENVPPDRRPPQNPMGRPGRHSHHVSEENEE